MEVVSSIDSRRIVLREISVPYLKDDAIAKTIRFEAESYLHAHSIDDVVIEYLKCGESESSSRLILCAVQNGIMLSHLDEIQASGVSHGSRKRIPGSMG